MIENRAFYILKDNGYSKLNKVTKQTYKHSDGSDICMISATPSELKDLELLHEVTDEDFKEMTTKQNAIYSELFKKYENS